MQIRERTARLRACSSTGRRSPTRAGTSPIAAMPATGATWAVADRTEWTDSDESCSKVVSPDANVRVPRLALPDCARPGWPGSSLWRRRRPDRSNHRRQPRQAAKRWRRVTRELGRFRTFDGVPLTSITRRLAAVDARDGRAVAATADVDAMYRVGDQLYVQPDVRLAEVLHRG